MKKKDNLSAYIHQELEQRELHPSHDTWNRIEARMNVAPIQQKQTNKWWLSAAIVVFFTAAFSVYFFVNDSTQNETQNELLVVQPHDNEQSTSEDSVTKLVDSEPILANNEPIESSNKSVNHNQSNEVNQPIQKGNVQVAVNKEKQQVEFSVPTKKMVVEKKEEIKQSTVSPKTLVANNTIDSVKVNKKKKNFVDPTMLLYSIENKENLKESNKSRVVKIDIK